eukprot:gnl/Spiro4/21713_TR10634_c0_g1_i1.p1 gnl/Spiro4/21713_TR10634_c0_g1~~gnl/Spiro4/21713_TR10634_c0_g1_i1.p1  ORF type:complete len:417 (+),score=89.58 gnl/Spiro4/21713_TR10634_c0_g1_i1:98-1348(+)
MAALFQSLAHNDQIVSNPAINSFIYQLFIHQRYSECLQLIEEVLKRTRGLSEYALYIKALIRRIEGKIEESLELFHAATVQNPTNPANLKQIARSLFLLGRHTAALEVYDEVQKITGTADWDILHNKGVCFMYMRKYVEAEQLFSQAILQQPHDCTFMNLAKVRHLQNKFPEALLTYRQALEHSPENSEILARLGSLSRKYDPNSNPSEHIHKAYLYNPTNPDFVLASASAFQVQGSIAKALERYRVAAKLTPNSAQLWNNIGLCFFTSKNNQTAALSCLKRALYLDPFEWIVSYNLGLLLLCQMQNMSAFHHLRCCTRLKPDYPLSYMLLGICLCRLGDCANGYQSYQKALSLEPHHLIEINFTISLLNNGQTDRAREHFDSFLQLTHNVADALLESEVIEARDGLAAWFRDNSV